MESGGSVLGRAFSFAFNLWHAPDEVPARAYNWAALALSLAIGAATVSVMLRHPHPSGWDPGQWLSLADLYRGFGRADLEIAQYPPLLFLLLSSLITLTGSHIDALYLTVGILSTALPLACYYAFGRATGDRKAALFFAVLTGLSQPMMEMFSWGGYPNLLSFAFFVPACALLVVVSSPQATRRDFLLLGLFAGLTLLTHPLSSFFLAFCGATYIVLAWAGGLGLRWVLRAVTTSGPVALGLYLPYLVLFLSLPAGGPTYITGEPTYSLGAALNPLLPRIIRTFFPYVTWLTIAVLLAASGATLLPLRRIVLRREAPRWLRWALPGPARRARANAILFLSFLLPVLLLPVVMWGVGLYTDFGRFMYYPVFPLAAATAAALSRASTRQGASSVAAWVRRILRRPAGVQDEASHFLGRWATSEFVVGSVAVLCAFAIISSGFHYLEDSSAYYLEFDDPEDADLALWATMATDIDDLLLLSPEASNQPAIKWLGGLSGRQTLGYFLPSGLFFQSERELSYQVYQFFNYRYALSNGILEVGTRGADDPGTFHAQVAVLNLFNAFPAVQFIDNETRAVFTDGSVLSLGAFSERSISPDLGDPTNPRLTAIARENGTGVTVTSSFALSGEEARITYHVEATRGPVAALNITLGVPASLCDSEVGTGYAYLRIRTGSVCTPTRVIVGGNSAPRLEDQKLSFRLNLSESSDATIAVQSLAGSSGLDPILTLQDGRDFLNERQVDYIVLLQEGRGYLGFLVGAYAFPIAYQNAKYVVLRVTAPAG